MKRLWNQNETRLFILQRTYLKHGLLETNGQDETREYLTDVMVRSSLKMDTDNNVQDETVLNLSSMTAARFHRTNRHFEFLSKLGLIELNIA